MRGKGVTTTVRAIFALEAALRHAIQEVPEIPQELDYKPADRSRDIVKIASTIK